MTITPEQLEEWADRFQAELRVVGFSPPPISAVLASAFLDTLANLPLELRMSLIEAHLQQIATVAPRLFQPRQRALQ
jgi:hypothetical protein